VQIRGGRPDSPDQYVFVIDDDESVRSAISLMLESVDLPHRCFASAPEFLQSYDESTRGCLVLDIRMPGMNGLEMQEALKKRHATLPINFITGHGDIPMAVAAMKAGALDFLRRPFREQDLLDRIQEALDAETQFRNASADKEQSIERLKRLTPRGREVFDCVTAGQANKVIAIELGISERTVEVHRSQVMKKLKARTLAQLVRMSIAAESQ
jgi:FixJ family two-component response regulator